MLLPEIFLRWRLKSSCWIIIIQKSKDNEDAEEGAILAID